MLLGIMGLKALTNIYRSHGFLFNYGSVDTFLVARSGLQCQ